MDYAFNLYAHLWFVLTIAIIVWHHKSIGKAVPPAISIVAYIDEKYHWNAWGHWLAQFSIAMALAAQSGWPWWTYALPSTVFSLVIEFAIQKNKLNKDTWFDLFTHMSGGFNAALLIHGPF
jgi:hypothetical protein